ncbi:MAG: long-chain fatty acid--CoA ligase [Proteobacteria bacterium]|nr:long-chain fatty acid--CoA ligase [Pseudomonadota bacterium]
MEERIWHKSYAPGVPWSLEYEKITIPASLTRSAQRFPGHTALNYMGRFISFLELDSQVNRFARALTSLGVKKGDRVAVCLPNVPQAIIANMAVLRMGAVVVQVNPLYTERELIHQLSDSGACLVVTLALLAPRMKKVMPFTAVEKVVACHIPSFLPFIKRLLFPLVKKGMTAKLKPDPAVYEFMKLTASQPPDPVEDQGDWDGLAALLYTGGTTGVAKGVMLTHSNLSKNVQQFSAWFPDLPPGSQSMVGNFPVFHSAGFTAIQNFCIFNGHQNILVPRPEPAINMEIIKKYRPSFLPAVPTIFVGLLADPKFRETDLSCIRGFFSGAAPLAAETIRQLTSLTGAGICEVYGLTETTPVATVTPWGGIIKPGTVGLPLPDTEIRLVDPEDHAREVPVGEPGEVAIRGPQVMAGYYNRPEETAKALDREGWFYSGDIGRLDEDGYLAIVDRKKDMIIAGGYNIYPVELDNVLFEHPKVLEAATVGVPDDYRGETVKAFVVVKPGETLTAEEIKAFCRERLAAYKVPRIVEFVDELPKSAVGKILRRELRDRELKKKAP